MRKLAGRVALGCTLALAVGGCEWEQFRSDAAHTGSVYETTLNTGNVADLEQVWSVDHDLALTGVVTSGGAVIVVADGEVRAYEQATGALRWQVPLPTYAGVHRTWSEPSAHGGQVYVGYMDPLFSWGARGGFLVIDVRTGEATESNGSGGALSTATFAGDDIWYRFGEIGPQAQGAFTGIEGRLADGRTWRSLEPAVGQGDESPPAVADGVVYARRSTSGQFDAYDAAGVENCQPIGNYQACSPLWSAPITGHAAPAVSGDTVFVSTGAGVAAYATDVRGPDRPPLWQATVAGPSRLALDGGPGAVTVFAGSSDGTLQAFDAAACAVSPSCEPAWRGTVGAHVGTPAVANGVVYVGSADGQVHAFAANGCGAATCEPLWSASVPGAPVTTIVANGRVIVQTATGEVSSFALA